MIIINLSTILLWNLIDINYVESSSLLSHSVSVLILIFPSFIDILKQMLHFFMVYCKQQLTLTWIGLEICVSSQILTADKEY